MLKLLLVFCISLSAFASENCEILFSSRHESRQAAESAFSCYEKASYATTAEHADALGKMSYLKFFIAEYFLDLKLDALYEAFTLGEKSILLYGPKYSLENYAKLAEKDLDVLAFALYSYGLSLSRYVDLKGNLEAIRRMEDIKKSMNTIIRIKREETVFYGALRTLGIFHTKVPSIAGGQIQLSRPYLEKAIQNTIFRNTLSLYPGNNIAYAEVLFKTGKKGDGCAQLKAVLALTADDVRAMENGFYLESMTDIQKVRDSFNERKCP